MGRLISGYIEVLYEEKGNHVNFNVIAVVMSCLEINFDHSFLVMFYIWFIMLLFFGNIKVNLDEIRSTSYFTPPPAKHIWQVSFGMTKPDNVCKTKCVFL